MRRVGISLSFAFFLSILSSGSAWAQATAEISGTVRDQSGAVLPGVEVTATQTATGVARSAVTNETGSYVMASLPLGPYRLEAALPGFRTFAQTGIVLQVNDSLVVNPVLQVGQVAETVEVQADAAIVETRNVGVGQVIGSERILELPLNGRNVTDLIVLAGGATQTGTTSDIYFAGAPRLSVAGGISFGTSYKLDGADHVQYQTGNSMPMPFPDALQEFKVETSGLSAQAGESTSVGAVTKAGTNEFHGNLFEFVRNDLFNARPYFSTKGSTLKRNQFGGTLGGPIIRNKLFFFGGYQGTTLRQDPADITAFLPTAQVLTGDFTALASPACNASGQMTLRPPFVDNRINPTQFSRVALNITNTVLSKAPTPLNACGEVLFGRKTQRDESQAVGKIDFQWSPTHSLFGRYMFTGYEIPLPLSFTPNNLLSAADGFDNLAQSFTLGDTYLIGTNVVNSFRLAVNRTGLTRIGSEYFDGCDVGISMYCAYSPNQIRLGITGGFSLAASAAAVGDPYNTTAVNLNDDISMVRGAHQFTFGLLLAHVRHVTNAKFTTMGNFTFNGQATGLGMADFLLGRVSELQVGAPFVHHVRQSYAALYLADTWKATQRLTLNYGVRWEPYLPQSVTNNRVYSFDYQKFQQGVKSVVYRNAPAGFTYPGDPGFIDQTGINKQWWNFGPRVGLAWDVSGDGRTSMRMSYGLNYDYLPMFWRVDIGQASPFSNELRLPSPAGGLENPWQGQPGGNPFPIVLDENARFGPYGSFQVAHPDIKTTNSSSWNLNVQRQVGTDWLLSATYLGSQTSHLWTQKPLNPATYFPGVADAFGNCFAQGYIFRTTSGATCSTAQNTNQRRKFSLERPQDGQFMGYVGEWDDGGTMSYHGMLLSVERRVANGATVSANHTWSHCVGDYGDVEGDGPDAIDTYTDPNNRRADRGNCRGDRRHVFNLTSVAETPQFAQRTLRILASGWRLSGIYRYSTGVPLNILAGTDRALNGVANQRANQILANPYGDKSARPFTNYLNPAAFELPAPGTIGNIGRSSLVGPSFWQFDLSLSRVFSIKEGQRFELRAEAYNVTNSFRPADFTLGQAGSSQGLNSPTFGQIRTARDPRILQFALKYVF